MKTLLPALAGAGLLLATSAALSAKIERTVEKTFTVQPGGTLKVETAGGGINVEPGSGNTVHIVVKERINASSDTAADELLKHLSLTLEQQGNDVVAVAKYDGDRSASWFHHGSWPPVRCSFTVTVPSTYNADLRTSGGGIQVGDLTGRMVARTSGGSLQFGKIKGPVEGHTSGGSIRLEACAGDVNLHTSGGSIHLGPVDGGADVRTSGGGISIQGVAGVVRAHTSGGSIHAAISGPLKGNCELSTSGGGITVRVDPKSAFTLDARTSGGGVHCDLPVTVVGGVGRSRLSGTVNGGGPTLVLRTSGGGIRVAAE